MSHYSDIREKHDDELLKEELHRQLTALRSVAASAKSDMECFVRWRMDTHHRTAEVYRKLNDTLVHAEHGINKIEKLLEDY